jgi:hypothetical protein
MSGFDIFDEASGEPLAGPIADARAAAPASEDDGWRLVRLEPSGAYDPPPDFDPDDHEFDSDREWNRSGVFYEDESRPPGCVPLYRVADERPASAGSPPPTPAPSVTEAALAVAGYRTAEPAPVATGTVYDAVHERNNGEDYVLLVIQVPEAEYADYLGTAVEVREKQP